MSRLVLNHDHCPGRAKSLPDAFPAGQGKPSPPHPRISSGGCVAIYLAGRRDKGCQSVHGPTSPSIPKSLVSPGTPPPPPAPQDLPPFKPKPGIHRLPLPLLFPPPGRPPSHLPLYLHFICGWRLRWGPKPSTKPRGRTQPTAVTWGFPHIVLTRPRWLWEEWFRESAPGQREGAALSEGRTQPPLRSLVCHLHRSADKSVRQP